MKKLSKISIWVFVASLIFSISPIVFAQPIREPLIEPPPIDPGDFSELPPTFNPELPTGSQPVTPAPSNQLEYVVLAPLPGVGTESDGVTKISNLASYIRGMFQFLIGLAVLLAVIMIIFGGIEYMTTDAISGKSAGKQRINNALLGLLLAIGSYLILYTIDPSILEIKIGDVDTSLKTTTVGSEG